MTSTENTFPLIEDRRFLVSAHDDALAGWMDMDTAETLIFAIGEIDGRRLARRVTDEADVWHAVARLLAVDNCHSVSLEIGFLEGDEVLD